MSQRAIRPKELFVLAWNSKSGQKLAVRARVVLKNEREPRVLFWTSTTLSKSDRSQETYVPNTYGPMRFPKETEEVLGIDVIPNSQTKYGETYVQFGLLDGPAGGNSEIILRRGYPYDGSELHWPDGQDEGQLDGKGLDVDNEAASTLVNNTALTRTITCPTNARWELYGGTLTNGDDVTRNVQVRVKNSSDKIKWTLKRNAAVTAGAESGYPQQEDNVVSIRDIIPFPLTAGDYVEIVWAAGGASTGGTSRSSAVVREWIEE